MVGEKGDVPGNTQEHRAEIEGADLRVGAAVDRNAALFHDAGHTGAASVWAHRNDGDLHAGRSNARSTRTRGIGDPGNRDEADRKWRDSGSRAEYFPRLLATARGNSEGYRGRLVSHRRSGRSGRRGILANYWASKKFDHSEFGPQYCSGTAGRGVSASCARSAASYFGRQSAQLSGGFGDSPFLEWIDGCGHSIRD